MSVITIGLTFPGTCEKAFTLYKEVFGVKSSQFFKFGDDLATAKDKDKVAYVEMVIGGVTITGDDTLDSSGIKLKSGNLVGITYEPDSVAEADRVFNALVPGGQVISPNTMYPWGYYGGLIDKYGVKWNVFFRTPRQG
jgi:PhnB protein